MTEDRDPGIWDEADSSHTRPTPPRGVPAVFEHRGIPSGEPAISVIRAIPEGAAQIEIGYKPHGAWRTRYIKGYYWPPMVFPGASSVVDSMQPLEPLVIAVRESGTDARLWAHLGAEVVRLAIGYEVNTIISDPRIPESIKFIGKISVETLTGGRAKEIGPKMGILLAGRDPQSPHIITPIVQSEKVSHGGESYRVFIFPLKTMRQVAEEAFFAEQARKAAEPKPPTEDERQAAMRKQIEEVIQGGVQPVVDAIEELHTFFAETISHAPVDQPINKEAVDGISQLLSDVVAAIKDQDIGEAIAAMQEAQKQLQRDMPENIAQQLAKHIQPLTKAIQTLAASTQQRDADIANQLGQVLDEQRLVLQQMQMQILEMQQSMRRMQIEGQLARVLEDIIRLEQLLDARDDEQAREVIVQLGAKNVVLYRQLLEIDLSTVAPIVQRITNALQSSQQEKAKQLFELLEPNQKRAYLRLRRINNIVGGRK